jgi:hypothetical protein
MSVTLLARNPTARLPWLHDLDTLVQTVRLTPDTPLTLPLLTPPLLLDTIGLPPLFLCRLLEHLTSPLLLPTLALVDPTDRQTRHLLHLCPAVVLLATEHTDPDLLETWLHLMEDTALSDLQRLAPACCTSQG